jgi:acyl-CoA oxidase
VGHGLDVINMETTATLLDDGQFDLHTPREQAAKYAHEPLLRSHTNKALYLRYMPPTTPVDRPCMAIVFARTVVHGEDRGVKPFLVNVHDGKDVNAGITTRSVSHVAAAHAGFITEAHPTPGFYLLVVALDL